MASGPTPVETLLVAPGSVTAAADSSLASPLVSCLLTAAGPSVVSSGDLGSLATAGFSFPTAPHANSGGGQTKVPDTVRVKSAGGAPEWARTRPGKGRQGERQPEQGRGWGEVRRRGRQTGQAQGPCEEHRGKFNHGRVQISVLSKSISGIL